MSLTDQNTSPAMTPSHTPQRVHSEPSIDIVPETITQPKPKKNRTSTVAGASATTGDNLGLLKIALAITWGPYRAIQHEPYNTEHIFDRGCNYREESYFVIVSINC
jgi:hypothetical protein